MNVKGKFRFAVTVILVLALTVSCFGLSASAESGLKTFSPEMAATGSNEYWPYFDAWNATKTFDSFAIRFKAASSFVGGMMALYVEGDSANVNVKLYQWNTDYATSVSGVVKATASFHPVAPEGSGSRMEANYTFSSAQPAGEYVAVFEVESPQPFFQLKSRDLTNNVECYVAGNLIDVDFFGGIVFEDSAAGGFKPLVNESIPFAEKETSESNADIFWDYFDTANDTQTFDDFAIRFKAAAPFTGGMITLYVKNTITLKASLYKWNKDYATSVAAAAQASVTFDVTCNDARTEGNYSFGAAQAAGEYVVVFEVVKGTPATDVLIQLKTKETTVYEECYVAGKEVAADFYAGILFVNYDDGGYKALGNESIPFAEKETSESNADIFWDYFNTANDTQTFDDFAIRFKTTAPFTGGMISLYVMNTITLKASLYKWNKDYATSVAAAAQASVTFDVTCNNARTEGEYSFGAEQAAGEYVVVFEVVKGTPAEDVLIQLKTKETTAYEECYVAGEKVLVDFHAGILFVNYDDGGFDLVEKITQTVPFYDTKAESVPLEISSSYGIQFATGMPFNQIEIACPSWGDNVGSLRWTLYKWDTSYEKTIGGKALATVDHINIEDNHVKYLALEEEMEAGEYLLLIENITGDTNQVGIWGVAGKSEYAHLYKDGVVYTEASAAMRVNVVGTDTNYYGTLSAAKGMNPGTGDTAAVPAVLCVVVLAAATYLSAMKKRKMI